MKRMIKRCIGIGILCFSIFSWLAVDGFTKEPEFPTRPIEFIITYGAGGSTDIGCRGLSEAASKYLPQPRTNAARLCGTSLIS